MATTHPILEFVLRNYRNFNARATRDALLAYYSGFVLLPRPAVLEPRSHDEAARRLGRSKDSTRTPCRSTMTGARALAGVSPVPTARMPAPRIFRRVSSSDWPSDRR